MISFLPISLLYIDLIVIYALEVDQGDVWGQSWGGSALGMLWRLSELLGGAGEGEISEDALKVELYVVCHGLPGSFVCPSTSIYTSYQEIRMGPFLIPNLLHPPVEGCLGQVVELPNYRSVMSTCNPNDID